MNTLFCLFPLLSSLLVASTQAFSQTFRSDKKLLPGDWNPGEGSSASDQAGKGWLALTADFAGNILMRENHIENAGTRPAFSNDDLMIAFREKGATTASYDGSETHAIHYDVSFSPDRKEIIFLGEKGVAGPRYRLIYELMKSGAVKVLFEIAPANKPGKFAKYVEATVHPQH